MSRVGVIGGGLGGLAAACTLAARGHKVTLLERNDWVGGKAAVLRDSGFRFDMGPTILTVPEVLRRIFAEAGRKRASTQRPPISAGCTPARRRATATSSTSRRTCTRFRSGSSSGGQSRMSGTPST
jgi:phytoene dehydrogenase-like protein